MALTRRLWWPWGGKDLKWLRSSPFPWSQLTFKQCYFLDGKWTQTHTFSHSWRIHLNFWRVAHTCRSSSAREEPHGIMGISDYTVNFIMNIPSYTSSEEESGRRALTLLLGLPGWMDPHYGYHGYYLAQTSLVQPEQEVRSLCRTSEIKYFRKNLYGFSMNHKCQWSEM